MNELEGVLKEFLVESHENLDQLDRDLVALEKSPRDQDRLAAVFRTVHTIKGTCGFFEFARLGAMTHAGENLLSLLRDGRLVLNPSIATALLKLVDAIRRHLAHIEAHNTEGPFGNEALIAELTRLLSEQTPAPVASESVGEFDDALFGPVVERNLRVDVGLLDKLMNLVGELVLARNQIQQYTVGQTEPSIVQASQRLNLITTELQEGVMKTRMQPIGNIWNKYPRIVRDLALLCGKEVRIGMEGKETELDKTILEAIKDPLTHLIRNAVDHGLETPEDRRRAGKSGQGNLLLRAYHEGGQVNIEVADDGRGLNLARIRQKALDRNLITADQASRLSDRETLRLVFLPGFSTAERVTNLSGRGVGMDVVKTNIEKIGGTVDLQTRPGQGTTIKVKIPLTLAIIPALILTSGTERFAIPQVNLLELVRLEVAQARRQIEHLYGVPVYRLRGNLLPLVYLDSILQQERTESDAINIIVLRADEREFGLVVEGINDTEEIVVKPLGTYLKAIPIFAGATILGDGRVSLILDVLGIGRHAGIVSEVRDCVPIDNSPPEPTAEARQMLLVFEVGQGYRMALPLDQVARLEELPVGSRERAAGGDVAQYRGQIMPLIYLDDIFAPGADRSSEEPSMLQVVVYSDRGRFVGLVARRILDIVETPLEIEYAGHAPGLLGTAVIHKRVTDLLDIGGLLQTCGPRFLHPVA